MSRRAPFPLLRPAVGGVFCLLLALGQAHARPELPLSGPAYVLADEAYRAYARGDFQTAVNKAREAVRQRPDLARLRSLLSDSLRALACTRGESPGGCGADPAFDAADAGYRAYANRDYAGAAEHARRAVALSPGHLPYRFLWVNALLELAQYDAAEQVLLEPESQADNDAVAQALLTDVRKRQARIAAWGAYEALQQKSLAAALERAERAVEKRPDTLAFVLILSHVQWLTGAFAEAEGTVSAWMQRNGPSAEASMARGLARQAAGRAGAAWPDYAAALAGEEGGEGQRLIRRLVVADRYLAAGDATRVQDLLDAADSRNLQSVDIRLKIARLMELDPQTSAAVAPPGLACDFAQEPPVCRLVATETPEDPAHRFATEAYASFDRGDFADAASAADKAVLLAPANTGWQLLLLNVHIALEHLDEAAAAATRAIALHAADAEIVAIRGQIMQRMGISQAARLDFEEALRMGGLPPQMEVVVLADLGRATEARGRFRSALENREFSALKDIDVAYLAFRIGDEATALALFETLDARSGLPPESLMSAGYAAQRQGLDAVAAGYFRRTVDAVAARRLQVDLQKLFAIRRGISDVERRWGAFGSLTYRGYQGPSGADLLSPGVRSSGTWQAGAELYWRPLGYRDGAYAELYGRVFQTLRAGDGAAAGADSTVGSIGARWKPFSATNLLFAIERVLPVGSQQAGDWLARVSYSTSSGTDLRVDVPSWWSWQLYAEAGRYQQSQRSYATTEMLAGRSYRLDAMGPTWVAWPHVALAADHDSNAGAAVLWAAGPGINFRYWFREDHYHAPQSYYDLSLQYRSSLRGAQGAHGFLLRFGFTY